MTRCRGLAMAFLVVARAAAAQEDAPAARNPREEAFRMVDAYVVSNMQESLGLSDEQFAKAIPLVKKLQTRAPRLPDRARACDARAASAAAPGTARWSRR